MTSTDAPVVTAPPAPDPDAFAAECVEWLFSLGARLLPLAPAQKHQPVWRGWPTAPGLTREAALQHVAGRGNIGLNCGASQLIILDAENAAAVQWVVQTLGYCPTVVTANAQNPSNQKKFGGAHFYLPVPEGVNAAAMHYKKTIELPGGGELEILAGNGRFAVAPPTYTEESGGRWYLPMLLGGTLPTLQWLRQHQPAPEWLWDRNAPLPEGVPTVLHGCVAPDTRPRRRRRSDGVDVRTARMVAMDERDVEEVLDLRFSEVGADNCGCPIFHFAGASNEKSITFHRGCAFGYTIMNWSGSVARDFGLEAERAYDRLTFAAAVRGTDPDELAREWGLPARPSRLQTLGPDDFDEAAAELESWADDGETEIAVPGPAGVEPTWVETDLRELAQRYRGAAATMRAQLLLTERQHQHQLTQPGGEVHGGQVIGVTGEVAETSDATPAAAVGEAAAETDVRREIRRFPGLALSQIPQPLPGEIYQYPYPATPEHVQPVTGAKTQPVEVLPPLANRGSHRHVQHEWIFQATPGLTHVAAAADARGVSRWGLLGALLPRVAASVPATVRLVPDGATAEELGTEPTDAGTSLNMYSVLVGPPNSGKTTAISAAGGLLPSPVLVPPGTGEGILKLFPRGDADDPEESDSKKPADGKAPQISQLGTAERSTNTVLMESDEIDVFVGEMTRQGSKALGFYRSMWMGGMVGNTTSDRERHSYVAAHTYRFGIILGAQPDTVATLFREANRGTPQRFLWLPAQKMPRRGRWYRGQLDVETVYWFHDSPRMIPETGMPQPPIWVEPPPAGVAAAEAAAWRSATLNATSSQGGYDAEQHVDPNDAEAITAAITSQHAVLQQLKICVLLAALDGLAQPQDVHWHAAGAVMEVRREVIRDLVALGVAADVLDSRKRGRNLGIAQAEAEAMKRSVGAERAEQAAERQLELLQQRFGGQATRGKLGGKNLTAALRSYRDQGIEVLRAHGLVDVVGGGSTADVVTLRSLQHASAGGATPSA